jgi:serralysin
VTAGLTLSPAQAAASYDATGWQAGLNPDALFDTAYYLGRNPDVAAAHIDPLVHYETYGWKEGRDPSALFSTDKYLAAYSDVKAAGIDPLLHFVAYGQAEGRTTFNV